MVSQPCLALAVGPWASDFTPSNLGFSMCHMALHLPSPRLHGGLKVTHAIRILEADSSFIKVKMLPFQNHHPHPGTRGWRLDTVDSHTCVQTRAPGKVVPWGDIGVLDFLSVLVYLCPPLLLSTTWGKALGKMLGHHTWGMTRTAWTSGLSLCQGRFTGLGAQTRLGKDSESGRDFCKPPARAQGCCRVDRDTACVVSMPGTKPNSWPRELLAVVISCLVTLSWASTTFLGRVLESSSRFQVCA